MSNETLFYIVGITLAVGAVAMTFLGMRLQNLSARTAVVIGAVFAAFVGATGTFAVLHAQDEKEHKAAELEHAGEEVEREEAQ